MTTITIDCGASFLKGAVFRDGVMELRLDRPSPAVHDDPSPYRIQQILPLVDAVRRMILDLAGDDREVCLCLSNEMHGFLLAFENGEPYTDYISWQKELGRIETDGASSVGLLAEMPGLKRHIICSGMPLRAGLPSSNLFYLYRSGGLSGGLHFYTLGSYLLKRLSRGAEPMEHPTNAAATGLFDLETGDWNREYIGSICAGDIAFPRIGTEPTDFVLDGIRIHSLPAIGDQQAALLGAGFDSKGDLSFNLGTGAQVSALMDMLEFGDGYQTRPYFLGKTLKTVPHIPSGRALNVYFRFFKSVLERYGVRLDDGEIWRGMTEAAKETNETRMKVDLSFFENAVTRYVSGSITQIEEHDFSAGSLMRAVLDQMADNFLQVADKVAPDRGEVKRLVFSGGIARRFDHIRSRIVSAFPGAEIITADNETMYGLLRYSLLEG